MTCDYASPVYIYIHIIDRHTYTYTCDIREIGFEVQKGSEYLKWKFKKCSINIIFLQKGVLLSAPLCSVLVLGELSG